MMQKKEIEKRSNEALSLLQKMIEIPSFSGEEKAVADLIQSKLQAEGQKVNRLDNNLWVYSSDWDVAKPTILLNAHHDTVKPNSGWKENPFKATFKEGRLIGLGSNDDGASLVCLMQAFLALSQSKKRSYNYIFTASAEEEISGKKSIRSILPKLKKFDFAIVGEPTGMEMAIAEKGLIVMHCQAEGVAGHAARGNGVNAIYKALKDIHWLKNYQFKKVSHLLGPVRISVTGIEGGTAHNVIPDSCRFMVDIRSTEVYRNAEIIDIIKENITSKIMRASESLNPSFVPKGHVLTKVAKSLGIRQFASPTLSDQSQIDTPSVKIGPGKSERSHTADEYIYINEIEEGIMGYYALLNALNGLE